MSSSPDAGAAVLDSLRGWPNPFDALVRPQRPDDRFTDLHVAALLQAPRELLFRIIDSYRLDEYGAARDLRETRVVTVLGPRGAGKTHMLEALLHRDDAPVQLIVRPSYFAPGVPFEEYVLNQLLNALLEEDPLRAGRPFDAVAGQLTRRLLRQALRGLGPTERLFAAAPSAWQRVRLLWRGGERWAARFEQLADDLDDPKKSRDVVDLAMQRGHRYTAPLETAGGSHRALGTRRRRLGGHSPAALSGDGAFAPAPRLRRSGPVSGARLHSGRGPSLFPCRGGPATPARSDRGVRPGADAGGVRLR
jgi:hypothetical protein